MSIATRLKRLEGDDDGGRCLVCGYDPAALPTIRVVTDEPTSPFWQPTPLPEPDPCRACGRVEGHFTMVIEMAYGDDEAEDV